MNGNSQASTDLLPVPYDCLIELGLTDEQIREAIEAKPLVVACQAQDHPGAWYDVDRAKKALRALGLFKHTKGRWAGVPLKLGQGLDPWQVVWVLAPIFGWVYHDAEIDCVVRVIRSAWIEIPRKNGKALALDTPILTATGWATMGNLQAGDLVHAEDGSLTEVTAVSPVWDDRPCFEVEFEDGSVIVADAAHEWRVRDQWGSGRSQWQTRETSYLAERFTIGSRGVKERRYSVSTDRVLDRPEQLLPIDPYVLGAWLGDGNTADAAITVGLADIEATTAALKASPGVELRSVRLMHLNRYYRVRVTGLNKALRAAGLLGNKRVPEEYLHASADQRRALLQGLMDTDGCVAYSGTSRAPACEFTSTKRALAEAVVALARSLGMKPMLHEGRATLNGKDCGPKYRVLFTAYREDAPFRMERKLTFLRPKPDRPTRARTNKIVDIRRVAPRPTRCIQVAHSSHAFLAGQHLTPTHNSTFASGISSVLLLADGEAGAEVYNAAGSTLQAGRVFDDAKRMMMTSPAARKKIRPLKEVVEVPGTGGILRCLSKIAETAHGLNVSGAVVDEVHTLRLLRGLVEAIETGVGARDQPLIIFITTADEAEEGTIYDEKHMLTRNIANRVVHDTSHYGVIWAAEATDDPFSEETMRKANPGAGKSPTWRYLRGEAKKAQNSPSYLPTYLRLSLNLRQRNQALWFDMNDWDACGGASPRAKLRKRRAWGGLDLSAVSDLSAWSVWVEPIVPGAEIELLTRLWVPENCVDDLEKRLQVPLRQWIDQGHITATDGDVIDYAAIESAVIGDTKHFDMQRISYDRMFAGQLVQNVDVAAKGVDVLPVAQTFAGLSAACKEFERLARSRAFRHDENPVLRWMASVTEVKNDGLDNIRPAKPDRRKASSRIDGIQAAVTGLDGYLRRPKQERRKVVVYGTGRRRS